MWDGNRETVKGLRIVWHIVNAGFVVKCCIIMFNIVVIIILFPRIGLNTW